MADLLQSLKRNCWQVLGLVATLLAIFAAYHVFVLERARPRLQVGVISASDLVRMASGAPSGIEVLYRGQPVPDAVLVVIEVRNVGNRPIRVEDYAQPLALGFPSGARIVGEALVTEEKPQGLGVVLDTYETQVLLAPILLNPGDSFRVQCIVSGLPVADLELTAHARIASVRSVEVARAPRKMRDGEMFAVAMFTTISGMALTMFCFRTNIGKRVLRSRLVDYPSGFGLSSTFVILIVMAFFTWIMTYIVEAVLRLMPIY